MSAEAPEEEGFLSRWSRRKRAAADALPEPPAEAAPEAPALPEAPARAACPIPKLPPVDLDALPSIEELTAQSDFSLFLRPGVPQVLRNAALRRMWSLDPAIRDYIGPVEYQWDFNTPGGLPAGFASELGGDVAKLLAQAIGKVEELAGPEPEAPLAEATPREARLAGSPLPGIEAPVPEALTAPTAEALAPPAPEALTAPMPDVMPIQPSPPDTPAPPSRRRHGGALPA
ncbi:DUF3306 domain-containing protein [Falsiroseomonas sp. HW251]|uniref:DUF3306 domain-containing protein n=1 Tax=Falsiroseomonas sp. HW251 TaxID=3390998 RepID=UPI003D312369